MQYSTVNSTVKIPYRFIGTDTNTVLVSKISTHNNIYKVIKQWN